MQYPMNMPFHMPKHKNMKWEKKPGNNKELENKATEGEESVENFPNPEN